LKVNEANTQSQSSVYNGIDCALDESEISNITSQLSTVVLNRTSQTENIKASSVLSDKPIEAVRALTYHNNLTSKPSSLDESEQGRIQPII
jgi:hypothetical protein